MKCTACLTYYNNETCPVCGARPKTSSIVKNTPDLLNDCNNFNEVVVKSVEKSSGSLNLSEKPHIRIISILGTYATLLIPLFVYFAICKNIEGFWLLLIMVLAPFMLFLWLLFWGRPYIIEDIFDSIFEFWGNR